MTFQRRSNGLPTHLPTASPHRSNPVPTGCSLPPPYPLSVGTRFRARSPLGGCISETTKEGLEVIEYLPPLKPFFVT